MLLIGILIVATVGSFIVTRITRYNAEAVSDVFCILAFISSILLFLASTAFIFTNWGVDGKLEAEKMRYESLVSQAVNHLYDSDNNIGKKELADDIREWNEDLAKYKKMKEDIWLKDFYPMEVDELKFIPNDILK